MSEFAKTAQGARAVGVPSSLRARSQAEPTLLPTVSVIVPVGPGDEGLIDSVLTSLWFQTYPLERFEVVVVSNTSAALELPDYPGMTVQSVNEERPGSYAARNTGVSHATGDLLAFTDADCVAHPDWLRHGVSSLIQRPGAVVAGQIQVFTSSDRPTLAEKHQLVFAFDQELNIRQERGLPTANLFVARKTIDSVGWFNPCMISGGDAEWSRRALRHGCQWRLNEASIVYHPARASFGRLRAQRRRFSLAISSQETVWRRIEWYLRWVSPRQGLIGRIRKHRLLDKRDVLPLISAHILLSVYQCGFGLSRFLFQRSRATTGIGDKKLDHRIAGVPGATEKVAPARHIEGSRLTERN